MFGQARFRKVIRNDKGWGRRQPGKSPEARKAALQACGKGCFLRPDAARPGYPICTKPPECALDCGGLKAAYFYARGARGATRRPDIAQRAKSLATQNGCDWTR